MKVKTETVLVIVTLAWFVLYFALGWQHSPLIISDAVGGILAAKQNTEGFSPNFYTYKIVTTETFPDTVGKKTLFYTPAYQFLPWIFMKYAGLNIGISLKISTVLLLVLAFVGWGYILYKCLGLVWSLAGVIVLSLWRFCHAFFEAYNGGELLVFAIFPFILIIHIYALKNNLWVVTIAGMLCPILLLLKQSALIFSGGLALSFFLLSLHSMLNQKKISMLFKIILYCASFSVSFLLMKNMILGSGETAGVGWPGHSWDKLAYLNFLSWIIVWGDWDSLLRRLFFDDFSGRDAFFNLLLPSIVLATIVFAFFFINKKYFLGNLAKNDFSKNIFFFGAISTSVCVCGMLYLEAIGSPVHFDARYYRSPVLCLLPAFTATAISVISNSNIKSKIFSVICLSIVLGIPTLYGAAGLFYTSLIRAGTQKNHITELGFRFHLLNKNESAINFFRKINQTIKDESVKVLAVESQLSVVGIPILGADIFPIRSEFISSDDSIILDDKTRVLFLKSNDPNFLFLQSKIYIMLASDNAVKQIPLDETSSWELYLFYKE